MSGTRTSTVVSKVKNGTEELTYTYDNNGNILTIAKNGVLQESFVYDSLNQLTRVNSVPQNKTILYAYDGNGNIMLLTLSSGKRKKGGESIMTQKDHL